MTDLSYVLTPFLAWLTAGTLKFIINSIKAKQFAFNLIGYGGLPSNHSAIVSSTTAIIGLKDGIASPSFGIAVTLAFIVILDASSLRRQIGKHAVSINKLNIVGQPLRERIGHTPLEIFVGILVGIVIATIIHVAVH